MKYMIERYGLDETEPADRIIAGILFDLSDRRGMDITVGTDDETMQAIIDKWRSVISDATG